MEMTTLWLPIKDGDPRGFGHYMAHYSSRKNRSGKPQRRFEKSGRRWIGNGEHIGMLTQDGTATFAWRRQQFRKDDQVGIECSIFRNVGQHLSSVLIRAAVVIAWQRWAGERLFTYCTATIARGGRLIRWGECFLQAGWSLVDVRGCKYIWELLPIPVN